MWFYAFGAFAITVFNIVLWLLTFSKRQLTSLARAYFWWSFFITIWAFGYGITLGGYFDYNTTLYWNKFCQAMATLIGPFFFHFGCAVSDEEQRYKSLFRLYLFLGIIIAIALFSTPYFVQGLWAFGVFKYQPLGGPLYIVFTSFFFWCTIHSFLVAALKFPKTSGQKRKQMKLFLLATGIAYSGGGTLFLQGFRIPLPSYGVYLILAYVLIIAYGIHKYQFLDLPSLAKKTVVFAGLTSFMLAIFAGVTFVTKDILSRYIDIGMFSNLVSFAIIVIGYEPLRKWLVEKTDKFLFQKKYDYHRLLKENAKQIAFIHNLDEIAKQVSAYLVKQGRIKNAALLMRTGSDTFELKYPLGYGGRLKRPHLILSEQSHLLNLLKEQGGPVTVEAFEKSMNRERIDEKIKSDISSLLRNLKAEALIPSFLGRAQNGNNSFERTLSNILVLGGKRSDEPYTDEDLDVFFTVAQESAIAAENARLVSDLVVEREEKVKVQKVAEQVNFTRSLKHEVGNKLVGVTSAVVNMRLHLPERVDRLRNKLKDRLTNIELKQFEEINALITKYSYDIEGMADRVKMVVDSVVGALAGDKNMKQVMDFRVPWETAKRNLNIDDTPKFIVKLPDRFNLFGNVYMMEQVFENLFKNSRDALAGQASDLIYLNASERMHEGKMVTWFEYWDAGQGVPEEIFEKVFLQGFSTKAKPESVTSMDAGHGQGMYVCRKIIEGFHGGKIWLEKRTEGGSKFVFWLPCENEVKENRENIS